jgi:hypothetical protein
VVQLRTVENGHTMFVPAAQWNTNTFVSRPLGDFPFGWALATVFVNGIPGTSSLVRVDAPPSIVLLNPTRLGNGSFRFTFTNPPAMNFTALAITNPITALSNWTAIGPVAELAPGQYQFIDTQATSHPKRFYGVRSP